ncbi:hypothetical protein, unlikely [Trypanosoma brucei gambiense DAL972]|uniref:Uncharacterized protein n=1 Tax=Trypanosoma brucei gambiense (strain MHOM/CI/86/DAL972) TaxID=679716 RepID=C9ZQ47_TRYB9|nr:hypothetical protein, unlikely [Trypanosoma brucei gambiense DAL972]CBH11527.1 hypothetical protein, unlikely [Trypanosoma brucei gambiense DAL972]|eukprot:XP_011773812.1 hypothetical protein, unlikely [Trypanosoma brucei gambiense DAL972]
MCGSVVAGYSTLLLFFLLRVNTLLCTVNVPPTTEGFFNSDNADIRKVPSFSLCYKGSCVFHSCSLILFSSTPGIICVIYFNSVRVIPIYLFWLFPIRWSATMLTFR